MNTIAALLLIISGGVTLAYLWEAVSPRWGLSSPAALKLAACWGTLFLANLITCAVKK